jgi:RimJ/RimL family protein N-acetyltransferase
MEHEHRWSVTWPTPKGVLRAYEPSDAEIAATAPLLAACYNDTYNRAMMDHSCAMTTPEVVEHFAGLRRTGGKAFLLERDGDLVGDADLRHMDGRTAEFAILVGWRPEQGKGLGTRFAISLHAFAFTRCELERIFVSIIPANIPSQRLFAKLGYQPDDSPAARVFADRQSDLTFSLARADFLTAHAAVLPEITWAFRRPEP